MTAPDLPAFLLARADDRERQAPDVHEAYCSAVSQVDWGCRVYDASDCDCGEPARVLADCAAKREIVERLQSVLAAPYNYDLMAAQNLAEDLLLALAQPFVDHPGFDDSWRV